MSMQDRLTEFDRDVNAITAPGDGVAVWVRHRGALAMLLSSEREEAWRRLCAKVHDVWDITRTRVWIKKSIAEADAQRIHDAQIRAELAAAGKVQP